MRKRLLISLLIGYGCSSLSVLLAMAIMEPARPVEMPLPADFLFLIWNVFGALMSRSTWRMLADIYEKRVNHG